MARVVFDHAVEPGFVKIGGHQRHRLARHTARGRGRGKSRRLCRPVALAPLPVTPVLLVIPVAMAPPPAGTAALVVRVAPVALAPPPAALAALAGRVAPVALVPPPAALAALAARVARVGPVALAPPPVATAALAARVAPVALAPLARPGPLAVRRRSAGGRPDPFRLRRDSTRLPSMWRSVPRRRRKTMRTARLRP